MKTMRGLIYNQFGACYNKIARQLSGKSDKTQTEIDEMRNCFQKSLDYIEKSLNLKLEEYGPMSFYVATAYNNYASWKKDCETSEEDFKCLSEDIYEYIQKAIYIREYVFSETGTATAESYITMAYCLEADKKYNKAAKYAEKAYKINPNAYKRQYERIIHKMNGQNGEV